jgi:hypothetical protein
MAENFPQDRFVPYRYTYAILDTAFNAPAYKCQIYNTYKVMEGEKHYVEGGLATLY